MSHVQEYLLPAPDPLIPIINHVFHVEKLPCRLHECEVCAAAALEAEVTYSVWEGNMSVSVIKATCRREKKAMGRQDDFKMEPQSLVRQRNCKNGKCVLLGRLGCRMKYFDTYCHLSDLVTSFGVMGMQARSIRSRRLE